MPPLSDSVFTSQPTEHAFVATRVDGVIPRDLDGTFFRSGPGLLSAGPHAPSCTVSPCAFVARPGSTEEDDGWLLAWAVDTEEETGASVVVLDARDIAAGPVARVRLGIHLPGTSHTRWATGRQLQAGSPSLP